ncbi:MAG: transglutaminase family protein [Defluviitaleaceae bacterium]|nr:transglutaminase family protein [Defluviitaleaceae bacterium]
MAWQWWDDFDRRLCGKWHNAEDSIFFEISFDGDASGVQVNLGWGDESCPQSVFYVECGDASLYFFHNDRHFRMEYIVAIDGMDTDRLQCIRIQKSSGMNKYSTYKRISTSLSDEDKEMYKSRYVIAPKIIDKIDILREYAGYGDIAGDGLFAYRFDERENMLDIIEKHGLDKLVAGKSDSGAAIALMGWLCGNYSHGNPPGGLNGAKTPQDLMKNADAWEKRTNCRGLSLILAQAIRAYGIKAFHVTCMPYEEPFNDCHVVVCVYCKDLGKWIMLDPTSNLYLTGANNEIVGIDEFRDILLNGGELNFNADAICHWDITGYCNYMAKNLIRIQRSYINGYGVDTEGCVTLVPEKYIQNEAKLIAKIDSQCNFITSRKYFWQT